VFLSFIFKPVVLGQVVLGKLFWQIFQKRASIYLFNLISTSFKSQNSLSWSWGKYRNYRKYRNPDIGNIGKYLPQLWFQFAGSALSSKYRPQDAASSGYGISLLYELGTIKALFEAASPVISEPCAFPQPSPARLSPMHKA